MTIGGRYPRLVGARDSLAWMLRDCVTGLTEDCPNVLIRTATALVGLRVREGWWAGTRGLPWLGFLSSSASGYTRMPHCGGDDGSCLRLFGSSLSNLHRDVRRLTINFDVVTPSRCVRSLASVFLQRGWANARFCGCSMHRDLKFAGRRRPSANNRGQRPNRVAHKKASTIAGYTEFSKCNC